MAVKKFPPPPTLSEEYQQLNRWLIEIQSILNSSGAINQSSVAGLPALFAQVAALALQVAANAASITTLNAAVATLQGQVTALNAAVATLQGQVTALIARNQILNANGAPIGALGNNGDLYINNTGAAGSFLYGKIAGVWTVFA